MNFWEHNRKKVAILFGLTSAMSIIIAGIASLEQPTTGFIPAASITFLLALFIFLSNLVQAINAFKLAAQLLDETNEFSVVQLLGDSLIVALENEHTWVSYTKPLIKGDIRGLPVEVSYTAYHRSVWSDIVFSVKPLAKDGSKRIYSERITFSLFIRKRLTKDIKPEVLDFINGLKAKGYFSGAGRIVSTKHFEQYAE